MSLLGVVQGVSAIAGLFGRKKKRSLPGGGVLTNIASIASSYAAIRGGGGATSLGGGPGLDALRTLPGVLGRTGGAVVRGAGSALARAGTWCRANAAACAAAGGVTAIAAMMESGAFHGSTRRRRRRGITANDLKSFRRVAGLIKTYSAPVRRMSSAATSCRPRRTRCP